MADALFDCEAEARAFYRRYLKSLGLHYGDEFVKPLATLLRRAQISAVTHGVAYGVCVHGQALVPGGCAECRG